MSELVRKLQENCDNSRKVRELKKAASNFILSKYNWDDVVKKTEIIYENK